MFHLKDRAFEIYEANMHGEFLENGLHCYLEITTKEIVFGGSNWAPSLSHQGLILKAKSLGDLDGLMIEWSSENNPHPEVGILSVFCHAETNNNKITFGSASGRELNFSWSGMGDVMWNSEFGSDVQFSVSGKLKTTIV
ncbi:hypothetical protein ABRP29_00095 [Pseudomonas sp. WHRI 8822A]|uniref:hypothetical protein n=1 Tax=Pseudomonas sp. WHRI 8822A TaxID=3162568 RepID=UPI0032EAA2DA